MDTDLLVAATMFDWRRREKVGIIAREWCGAKPPSEYCISELDSSSVLDLKK